MKSLAASLAVLLLALLIAPAAQAQFLFSTPAAARGKLDQPLPAALLQRLSAISRAGLTLTTPVAPAALHLKRISGPQPGPQPTLLYVGAEFCPYCAAQRWGLALTLLRFGQLQGVRYMLSTAHDVYPDTPTLSFYGAHYDSRVLHLLAIETQKRDQQPLMPMPPLVKAIFGKFDAPPYVQMAYGIPFVYLGGRYLLTQPMISPAALQGMDWDEVVAQLGNADGTLYRTIMPQVNLLTAAVCSLDGGQPAAVCKAPGVQVGAALLTRLPRLPAR